MLISKLWTKPKQEQDHVGDKPKQETGYPKTKAGQSKPGTVGVKQNPHRAGARQRHDSHPARPSSGITGSSQAQARGQLNQTKQGQATEGTKVAARRGQAGASPCHDRPS